MKKQDKLTRLNRRILRILDQTKEMDGEEVKEFEKKMNLKFLKQQRNKLVGRK